MELLHLPTPSYLFFFSILFFSFEQGVADTNILLSAVGRNIAQVSVFNRSRSGSNPACVWRIESRSLNLFGMTLL